MQRLAKQPFMIVVLGNCSKLNILAIDEGVDYLVKVKRSGL